MGIQDANGERVDFTKTTGSRQPKKEPIKTSQEKQTLSFSPEILDQITAVGVLLRSSPNEIIQVAVNYYLNDVFIALRDNFMKEVSTSKMNFTDDQAKRMVKFMEQNKMSQEEFMQCAIGYFIENHTTP